MSIMHQFYIEPLPDPDSSPELEEAAYRRGFKHALGYIAAMLSKGGTERDLWDYIIVIDDWRYHRGPFGGAHNARQPPPVPKRRRKKNG